MKVAMGNEILDQAERELSVGQDDNGRRPTESSQFFGMSSRLVVLGCIGRSLLPASFVYHERIV